MVFIVPQLPRTVPRLSSRQIKPRPLLSLVIAFFTLILIARWNRYVFLESNLPILLLLLTALALAAASGRIPKGIQFPSVAIAFAALMLYAWVRLDDPLGSAIRHTDSVGIRSGFAHLTDMIIFYALFVVAALAYYWKPRFPLFLWFLIIGYILAFILRNSQDFGGLQQGYHLSAGYVLVTLIPFTFLRANRNRPVLHVIPVSILALCTVWLAFAGARAAVVVLLVFLIVMYGWPLITRNRRVFYLTFFSVVASILIMTVLYMSLVSSTTGGLIENSSINIFAKRLGTRIDIWTHLLYLIGQQPWFGYGTDYATKQATPLAFLDFSYQRNNLAGHSTYFEILYRLGVVGLSGFVLIIFRIWVLFWEGRDLWVVRISGAFLVAMMLFNGTGGYFLFSGMQLRSGFGWIILGIGAGACLRAAAEKKKSAVQARMNGQ